MNQMCQLNSFNHEFRHSFYTASFCGVLLNLINHRRSVKIYTKYEIFLYIRRAHQKRESNSFCFLINHPKVVS